MKILIIGSGGREHALAWKITQSPQVTAIYVAPGNAGTSLEPRCQNIDIKADAIGELIDFAKKEAIDLTIVGPEAPLCAGIVDAFAEQNLACFGPNQQAAQLEGSKAYSKHFMIRHGIPTAKFGHFHSAAAAEKFIEQSNLPLVVKADGLAAGKGVIIAETRAEAYQAIDNLMNDAQFGEAGKEIIVEEFLQGIEASFIVISDGKHVLPLANSQDHKAIFDGDKGPNTGGMGAYSPTPIVNASLQDKIMSQIVYPTINGMAEEGHPYRGFLYVGLMIDQFNQPHVLEYNCRLGDPETQVILPRMQSDLVELCQATLNGQLNQQTINWDNEFCLGVVVSAKGYPGDYTKGQIIDGWQALQEDPNCQLFHAGTSFIDQQLVSQGGRLFCVTAKGENLTQAKTYAYNGLQQLNCDEFHYRHDIGDKAIKLIGIKSST